MTLSQQLIQLLTETPGSIVYHVIILLAVEAAFGLGLWQWRREPSDDFARRMTLASGGIIVSRLILIFAIILMGDEAGAVSILPPLVRAIDSGTAVLLVWTLAPHPKGMPRLGDVVLAIILLLIGLMFAFFTQEWMAQVQSGTPALGYSGSRQAAAWDIFQMVILGAGGVLIIIGREDQWVQRLLLIGILFAAHFADLVSRPDIVFSETDLAYWVRLGYLFAFPLLAVIAYRHNLAQILPAAASGRSAPHQLVSYLEISRSVLDSWDVDRTLDHALNMVAEITEAEFSALAIIRPDNPELLHLVGRPVRTHRTSNGVAAGNTIRQDWALSVGHWPAIRLAMQQGQQVELIPDGLGARQLFNFYQELNLEELGALLINPLSVDANEIGVLLLAGSADGTQWSEESKKLASALGDFLAQAIHRAQLYEQAVLHGAAVIEGGESYAPEHIKELEAERDEALAKAEALTGKWQEAEAQLTAERRRVGDLSAALIAAKTIKENQRVKALEEETEALRESLLEAEQAMALAAAGESRFSADWVMRTVTRYSGELEDAQARINRLEAKLSQQKESSAYSTIASRAREIRTPLTSIAGYTDLLLSENVAGLDSNEIGLLRRMRANIKHMSALLDQIIQLARQEHRPIVERVQVNVQAAIETAINAVSAQIREKNLTLDLYLEESLPSVPSENDAFYQIVAHLLNNACQVSVAESRLSIRAHHETVLGPIENGDDADRAFLHLAVTDGGGNKSQEMHALILEAHRQPMNNALQAQLAESGYSLSAAVALIAAHGGRTWVNGKAEEGTTFSLLLPVSGKGSPIKEQG